jgi:hypothetical protein
MRERTRRELLGLAAAAGAGSIDVTVGDEAAGESGYDEMRMFPSDDSEARFTWGEGNDRVTANVGNAPTDGSARVSGPLFAADCERLPARYRDEVTLTAPPHVVESAATAPVTLRGVTLGGTLVRRFRVQRGP